MDRLPPEGRKVKSPSDLDAQKLKRHHSRDQAFESIYQKAVARESPGNTTRINKGGQSFVESVKAWFESRHEWLIVFDGVTSETDNDLTEWAKFVPDSQNSRYGLLYIKLLLPIEIH